MPNGEPGGGGETGAEEPRSRSPIRASKVSGTAAFLWRGGAPKAPVAASAAEGGCCSGSRPSELTTLRQRPPLAVVAEQDAYDDQLSDDNRQMEGDRERDPASVECRPCSCAGG